MTQQPAQPETRFIFRADDHYSGGPIGMALGAEADSAEIQDFAQHVLRKESNRTSRYASFSTELKVARRFTSETDLKHVRKVELARLRDHETRGSIKIWDHDLVAESLSLASKKSARQAGDVRAAMRKNGEILIEGQIPSDLLTQVR